MIAALFPWLSLMGAGFVAGILLLVWGFRSGQFSEQDRARFIPLRDNFPQGTRRQARTVMPEIYLLLALMIAMAVFIAVTFGLTLFRQEVV